MYSLHFPCYLLRKRRNLCWLWILEKFHKFIKYLCLPLNIFMYRRFQLICSSTYWLCVWIYWHTLLSMYQWWGNMIHESWTESMFEMPIDGRKHSENCGSGDLVRNSYCFHFGVQHQENKRLINFNCQQNPHKLHLDSSHIFLFQSSISFSILSSEKWVTASRLCFRNYDVFRLLYSRLQSQLLWIICIHYEILHDNTYSDTTHTFLHFMLGIFQTHLMKNLFH